MEKKNYFIKSEYESQRGDIVSLSNNDGTYWNNERIECSNYYQWSVYKFAYNLVNKYKLRNVIDIGCGVATKLMKLIYPICNNVTGVDKREAIQYCNRTYTKGQFLIDDFENPSVIHNKYDLVISSDVIEHILNPDMLLEYIKKASHKDSYILLSTPDRDILRGEDCIRSDKPEHIREWNREEFRAYLTNSGFDILLHKRTPFIKFSFKKQIYRIRKSVIKRCGTVKTNQMILCKLK